MAFGGRSQLKMSEETFDFVCTTCAEENKTAEAVKYCVECGAYCCQYCTDAHKFPALRSHNLLDVSQRKEASDQQSSLPEFPTERCTIHKGKVLDMYCEGHDVVGCYVCIAKDHKSCQDSHIHSIPDMLDTIIKLSDSKQIHSLLKDTLVSLETVSKSKATQMQSLITAREEAMGKVNAFQKALEVTLSKLAESSRKEIEAVYKHIQTEILNEQHIVDGICEDLKMTDDKLIRSEGNRGQRFVCTKIAQGKINQADGLQVKHDLRHNTDVLLSFIPNESLMGYIHALQCIGQVQKHDPYSIQALESIGQVQKHDPSNTQALQSIGQVQKHDPSNIQALQGMGQVQKHDPSNIQALQGIGQVQKHDPSNIQALQSIGQVQKHNSNIQALQGIGQVQKHDPSNIQALQGIGQVQKHDPSNIQVLQGIGQVQEHDPFNIQAFQGIGQVQKHGKQKHDLYKIKGSKDITIKLPGDSKTCNSNGCCLTHNNQLLVTDFDNKNITRIDIQKMSVVDYCTLDSQPCGVCCISKHEVAVACMYSKKIQFVSILDKMTPTRQIKTSHQCYGIAFKDGQLYVTNLAKSLYVYDMTGILFRTITQDNAGNKLFNFSRFVSFNQNGDRMFVGGGDNGLVCLDGTGNYLSTIKETDIKNADGVCVDGRGNMFVVGVNSGNVVQFCENGKKHGVVVKRRDGLHGPRSVCFHQELNRMFVTMEDSDVVKMYVLE